MSAPIPDTRRYATFVFSHEGRQYVQREDYEHLRSHAIALDAEVESLRRRLPETAACRTVKRTERGWIGHFICADRCRFRRNTLLECGDVRVVVSSVGAFFPKPDGGVDTIGCERHYETMAFIAEWDGTYWDADVFREVAFESPRSLYGFERESDEKANNQHEAVVDEISMRLAGGLGVKLMSERYGVNT